MNQARKLALSGGLVALVAAVAAVLIVLAARGGADVGDPDLASETTTTTAPPPDTVAVPPGPPVAPLTGQVIEAALERPAVVVKIDNAEGLARPQAGVNAADVVYEEKVEGAVTRFAAIFHSQEAGLVGPVRSARSTDLAIMRPLKNPIFAYSGANDIFGAQVREAPLVDLGFDTRTDLYYRRDDRPMPDNVFSSTTTFREAAAGAGDTPRALFSYRGETESLPTTAVNVAGIQYGFGGAASGGAPVEYYWDPGRQAWARWQNGTAHVLEGEGQITSENLIVQFVRYQDTGLTDAAGTPVPEAVLVGEGDGWVLSAGHAVTVRWQRDSVDDVTRYTDTEGNLVALTPGRSWVALVPAGGGSLVTCESVPGSPSCT